MNDTEFMDRAEQLLQALEAECDRISQELDVDLDSQRSGAMVTLTFADRSQIVVNLQKPLHEVWLATRLGGYHYKWIGSHWADTKSGEEFAQRLTNDATQHAGTSLRFLLSKA